MRSYYTFELILSYRETRIKMHGIGAQVDATLTSVYKSTKLVFATDMYEDEEETLPEEIQRYWACHRAQAQFSVFIEYLDAYEAQQSKVLAHGRPVISRPAICRQQFLLHFLQVMKLCFKRSSLRQENLLQRDGCPPADFSRRDRRSEYSDMAASVV